MRNPHYLPRLKTARYPRELIAFDCETEPHYHDEVTVEHRLVFGWACYSRWIEEQTWSEPQWHRFETGLELWEWVHETARPKQQTYIYSHNVNFDWQASAMLTNLPLLGYVCDQAILEDPPNAFRFRGHGKTLRLLDSFNYFYASLKQIGDRIGLPKLDMPDTWLSPEQSDAYCQRDTLIVLRAVQQWIAWLRDNGLGSLAISLAAQSMNAYRYRFMDHDIFLDDSEKARTLERKSYFGGRVEAYHVHTPIDSVTCLDINSMYPYVMRENTYPTKLRTVLTHATVEELHRWLRVCCLVADVTLTTNVPAYPERGDGKLLFPTGTFRTTLTTPELQHALTYAEIHEIHQVALYDHAPIFTKYMDDLYALRVEAMQQEDDTAVYFLKKMINSLYGKWAQRGGHEEIIAYTDDLSLRVEDEWDATDNVHYRIRYIGGVVTRRSLDTESRNSFPAISSHVTAHGRMMLWRLIEKAGRNHVYYTDTDSLHVDVFGLWNLLNEIDPQRLGALKVEKCIDRAIYYGPKDYFLDGEQKTKGVRARATEVERGVYEQEQFVSLRGSCIRQWSGGPLVRRTRKRLARVYTKGDVDASGRVLPFVRDGSGSGDR